MDIVNAAANALENTLDGLHLPVDASEFVERFRSDPNTRVLDVRSTTQAAPFVAKYGARWQNIPQEELAARLDEVTPDEKMDARLDEKLWLICGAGPRAYEAQLVLRRHGIEKTCNIQGGIKMVTLTEPDFMENAG